MNTRLEMPLGAPTCLPCFWYVKLRRYTSGQRLLEVDGDETSAKVAEWRPGFCLPIVPQGRDICRSEPDC